MAIGDDPKDLKIGIVNDEAGTCDYGNNFGNVWNDEITCHFGNLSCRFLHNFDDSIATQVQQFELKLKREIKSLVRIIKNVLTTVLDKSYSNLKLMKFYTFIS